ncbi:MAG: Nif3-like dinuclear metal center hexameric protein [Candidatus Marinarcus sp.]|uniref:Nif3-like dinuclear metal center hexameric protein n=1 Tax=Candidatus Marinarcus sp. TaxID=3100987 RepID=UPI003B001A81
MKIKELYQFLDELSPFSLQEKWDNSGLLVGNPEDEFKQLYISLDLDDDMLEEIEPNSLIVTHHPLIFSPLKRVNFDSYATKILRTLIQKNIGLISMHTNFDITHLNRYVAEEILGLELISHDEYICYAKVNLPFDELSQQISSKLDLEYHKVVRCSEDVNTVALVTGAGMSLLPEVKADCFLTGDIKYHDAMEAKNRGISLIDIGHYESEKHFSPLLLGLCENYLKINELKAIIRTSKNPFMFHL